LVKGARRARGAQPAQKGVAMRLQRWLLFVCAALYSVWASAADITGTWTASFDTQIGKQNYTYTFAVDGTTLTGRAKSDNGDVEITEGKVENDTVSFVENLNFQGNPLRIAYTGKITSDNEIKFTRDVAGQAKEDLTATRSPCARAAERAMWYARAAELVVVLHAAFAAFVVLGLVLILVGAWRRWAWVRNPWFRCAHLAAIGIVAAQAWLGVLCPLTVLENALRTRAGDDVYRGGFIAHWAQELLYYSAPAWVFMLCYTLFGAMIAATWFGVRPRPFGGAHAGAPRAG
jgi:hypothetical protein